MAKESPNVRNNPNTAESNTPYNWGRGRNGITVVYQQVLNHGVWASMIVRMSPHRKLRLGCLLCAFSLVSTAEMLAQKATSKAELVQWRTQVAADLVKSTGWLSLVALEWLQQGPTSVGSAPDNNVRLQHGPPHLAVFTEKAGAIHLTIPPQQNPTDIRMNGRVAAAADLKVDDPAIESAPLTYGSLSLTVIRRGDRLYLRIKDSQSPDLLAFRGLHWFPRNPALLITATWVPTPNAPVLHIPNVLGQVREEPSPGFAEFVVAGRTVKLLPTVEGDFLFFDFRDLSSRSTTYGGGRFLYTKLPSRGITAPGTVVLDFNYAQNPPCAYTPFATCPLPTAENRLQVSIPAGEKRYRKD